MFITRALVYVASSSVNHSCYSGTAGVSGCFTSRKNPSDSLRTSDSVAQQVPDF